MLVIIHVLSIPSTSSTAHSRTHSFPSTSVPMNLIPTLALAAHAPRSSMLERDIERIVPPSSSLDSVVYSSTSPVPFHLRPGILVSESGLRHFESAWNGDGSGSESGMGWKHWFEA
ncbi:hypothetical protein GALMADRAFT_146607 [Galerina marginata CBS 339.88]|uniref:Uncharacterized protein n=1 Tax=Galerina marginata (strain CBS 339.88) TaxID=685588 RepID=A0A067SDP4_GALM3|nr:hypothetical protein GALMADRAFT_146607 [Galerina marginata CBS 339.88]